MPFARDQKTVGLAHAIYTTQPKKMQKGPEMKTLLTIPLRYNHTLRASFTLPIHKKAIHPQLMPFSSKKLKGMRHDFERASHRIH